MSEIKWENPELFEMLQKHGTIIAKHERVTAVAILEMYDDVLALVKKQYEQAVQAEILQNIRMGNYADDISHLENPDPTFVKAFLKVGMEKGILTEDEAKSLGKELKEMLNE